MGILKKEKITSEGDPLPVMEYPTNLSAKSGIRSLDLPHLLLVGQYLRFS
jgi:hypothetical protein